MRVCTSTEHLARLFGWDVIPGPNLPWLYLLHVFQVLFALATTAIFKYWLAPADYDYGLHWPRGKSYILPAFLWGIFFAAAMTAIDFAPQLVAHTKPDIGVVPAPQNVRNWIIFETIYLGPTLLRAPLVVYLAVTMPRKLRMGRYKMNVGGIIVAVVLTLVHAATHPIGNWFEALSQFGYGSVMGVFYAYWLRGNRKAWWRQSSLPQH